MKKLFLLFVSFVSLFTLFILIDKNSKINAEELYFTKGEVLNQQDLVTNVKWAKYKATSNTDKDGSIEGKQVVNVVTMAPNSVHFVTWSNPGNLRTTPTNLLDAAKQYEQANPNMMVVAGINGDYFDINGDFHMINAASVDGKLMKATTAEEFYSIGLKDNGEYLLSNKGEKITESTNYYLAIYDASRINVVKIIELENINQMPENGTTFFHKAVKKEIPTDSVGYSISLSQLTKYDDLTYYKGLTTDIVNETDLSYETIITKDLEIAKLLDANPQVEIYKMPTGKWKDYSCIIGCPSQFLKDGNVLSYAEIGDQGEAYISTRAPRTALGFKEDGTIVFMTIDGRQSPLGMDGVTLRENAIALKNEGCTQGFNFDGGGSTTIAVRIDGVLTVTNSPSDGNIRRDSDFLLAVVPRTNIEFNYEINEDKLTGSFSVEALNGFEYTGADVYLDGKLTNQDYQNIELSDLTDGNHNISLYVKYLSGKQTIAKPFYSKSFSIEKETNNIIPANSETWIEKTDNGFRVYFSIDDPDNLITNIKALVNDNKGIVVRRYNDAYVNVVSTKDGTFNIDLSYMYRTSISDSAIVNLPRIIYNYQKEETVVYPENIKLNLKITKDNKYLIDLDFDGEIELINAVISYDDKELFTIERIEELEIEPFDLPNDLTKFKIQINYKYNYNQYVKEEEITIDLEDEREPEIIEPIIDPVTPPADEKKKSCKSCKKSGFVFLSLISLIGISFLILKKKR